MQTTPEPHLANGSNLITTFHLAQKAPLILKRQSSSVETVASSPSGDDKSALLCTEQLAARFGMTDERIIGLRGMYEEAVAENPTRLEECLQTYDLALSENPPVLKRRIALLRSLSRPVDAISSLINLLDAVPTDAEAWCELADLYHSQGMSSQAAFCLEEALLIVPNSWNIHAFLGEILYSGACASETTDCSQLLEVSIHHFSRSIELCTDYLRGFYGLVSATSLLGRKRRLMDHSRDSSPAQASHLTDKLLDELTLFARSRLDEIVRSRSSDHQAWKDNQGELIAAKELLHRLDESPL
ncbi:hypothetical protein ASPFODRAFT_65770 [Aspergillus luchuensis CBS 106.47]|uniref:ER membrane protein complex subunit 2 n=1 Tax=Aspergillus luchuensis (strain CBS 106.47) TaxID=1137211 RepID=A0A1M3T242_ASPLC|nr:hypothetical protein ASPFODRAFT_65770 [Aspergillus luchuensis CBS 106.47]GAA89590.1 tetratricopeptide repeat domain protein [Aspergillus luchuensis IFO 4308]